MRSRGEVTVAMKKYTFVAEATISLSVDVTASCLLEAIDKAQSASVMSLCHQCAGNHHGEWSTSGELDCDPSGMTLVATYVDGEEVDEAALDAAKKKWCD